MRVYIASTPRTLARAYRQRQIELSPAFAVTPAVREWYTSGDEEELEYAVFLAAARASIGLLAESDADIAEVPAGIREPDQRVVISLEVPETDVVPQPIQGREVVRLRHPMVWSSVVCVHVDDGDAQGAVRAARQVWSLASEGAEGAQEVLSNAEGYELLWFDASEIDQLVLELE